MGRYSYKLYKNGIEEKGKNRYRRSELEKMTTYQLREICNQEKLIKNILNPLDKEELIRLIMRYRGKEEVNFIKEFKEEGVERLENFLQKTDCIIQTEGAIHFPARITLYENLAVDILDKYEIKADFLLKEGNLLLVNEEYKICTIFSLIQIGEKYYLIKEKEMPVKETKRGQYSILYFSGKESEFLFQLYYGYTSMIPSFLKLYKIPILDFIVKKLKETNNSLIIDFGSSNTTAGIYTDSGEFKIVSVIKKENRNWEETYLIPSTIGIKAIEDTQVQYIFGYEAQELLKKDYLEEDLPIFYDMKRYISDADRKEKIVATNGHHTWLNRKELLKAYLEYIISLAVQRFKCQFTYIQLLSPVRQKGKFKKLFSNLLENYKVESSLDEGTAVLFHSIYHLMERGKKENLVYEQNRWYQTLVIDCGGGTTDLTSGNFRIKNNRVSYRIDLQTTYENGDTNFGGNNLTFKIMQLLKIRLTEELLNLKYSEFVCFQKDIFRFVDKEGIENVYKDLEKRYKEIENIVPTLFKNYEGKSVYEYFRVKSNYYYLFQMAETIKKLFFSDRPIYKLEIGTRLEEEKKENSQRKKYFVLDKWKLSYKQEGNFFYFPNLEKNIQIHFYEIQALLKPSIYNLMKKFLEDIFDTGELMQYEIIKLSGQSCYVEIFKEALKEFIPGKLIQGIKNQKNENELKLNCIYGALQYFQSKRLGYVEIEHHYTVGALPYEVSAYTHENLEKVLIHSLKKEEDTGFISRFMEGEELILYLKDTRKNILRQYYYQHKKEDFQETTYYKIEENYPDIIKQEETDNIVNGESKYFVWACREEWGFYVLPVLRENHILFAGNAIFFDFEDDTWEENFFDGQK